MNTHRDLARRRRMGGRSRIADDCADVLRADVFNTVIVRERRRADRYAQALFLLRVSLRRDVASGSPDWTRVVRTLRRVKRESDVLGWVQPGTVLGVLVPDIRGSAAVGAELARRFGRELDAPCPPGVPIGVSIDLDVHPGALHQQRPDEVGPGLVDAEQHQARSVAGALYPRVKRACDVAASLVGIVMLAPVLMMIAAVVKMNSRGPALFRQTRVGHKGRPFTLLKFRTMQVDAGQAVHQQFVSWFIKAGEGAPAHADVAPFKLQFDPRVTRVGAFLRKTSLDELPQLWNVLRGDMSLVGPRPPIDYEVEQYAPWHLRRVMDVKPGMTGLWQVNGRSRTTFDQMVRLDLRYAKTCSLWGDFKILWATPAAVISGKGAR